MHIKFAFAKVQSISCQTNSVGTCGPKQFRLTHHRMHIRVGVAHPALGAVCTAVMVVPWPGPLLSLGGSCRLFLQIESSLLVGHPFFHAAFFCKFEQASIPCLFSGFHFNIYFKERIGGGHSGSVWLNFLAKDPNLAVIFAVIRFVCQFLPTEVEAQCRDISVWPVIRPSHTKLALDRFMSRDRWKGDKAFVSK